MAWSIHESMGYWVNRLAGTMREEAERRVAPLGISMPQAGLLICLYQGQARTPRELSRFAGIDGAAVTRLLDRLEAKALVVRVSQRRDRRSFRIDLTRRGRLLGPRAIRVARAINGKFTRGLSKAEVAAMRRLIGKMLANLGTWRGKDLA